MRALDPRETSPGELRGEPVGVARRPRVDLDEDLGHARPRVAWRPEHGLALRALDVQLDDDRCAGGSGRPFGDDVRERLDGDPLRADLVLCARRGRSERVPPRRRHHVELRLPPLGAHGRGPDRPVGAPRPEGGGGPLQELEIRPLRLERDHGSRAPRERIGGDVPLVRADVEHQGPGVVRASQAWSRMTKSSVFRSIA